MRERMMVKRRMRIMVEPIRFDFLLSIVAVAVALVAVDDDHCNGKTGKVLSFWVHHDF